MFHGVLLTIVRSHVSWCVAQNSEVGCFMVLQVSVKQGFNKDPFKILIKVIDPLLIKLKIHS